MRHRRWYLGLLVVAGACAAPVGTGTSAPTTPAGKTMISFSDLISTAAPPADHREAYGADPLQFGELRLPRRADSHAPVVVLIHGGCWRSAYDLTHAAPAAAALADAGYAVWVPEYRRVGDDGGGWPGTFDDIANAVDHVRALAVRYPSLDTARVVLGGHSAGGQLALWAASRRDGDAPLAGSTVPAPPAQHALRVVGVVSLAGITDLAEYGSASGSCNSAVAPLLGGTVAEVPDRYRAVSPIERLPIGVPVRVVHGASDPIVPLAQSRALVAKSHDRGAVVTLVEVPGAGHFDVVAPQSTAWPAVLDAVRALAPVSR